MDNLSFFVSIMPDRIKNALLRLDSDMLFEISEIRIRRQKPLIIYIGTECFFVSAISNNLLKRYTQGCFVVDSNDFDLLISRLCEDSIHTNMHTMVKGYITVNHASRCGIASKAVYENGSVRLVRDINSVNIRIARQIKGISFDILESLYSDGLKSVIVAGKAMSGKTTFIRDMAYYLSSGFNGKYCKTAVIDDREELSGGFNTGINTDVLSCFTKTDGIEIAIRTLSPELIVCDEIVNQRELESISFGFKSGAKFIVSIHLNSVDDCENNSIYKGLLRSGEFDRLLFIDRERGYIYLKDLRVSNFENSRNFDDYAVFPYVRNSDLQKEIQ